MQRKKKSHISFNKAVKQIRKKINKNKSKDIHDLSKSGYLAAKKTFKNKTSSVSIWKVFYMKFLIFEEFL
jgi:hypothetical protein